MSERDLIPSDRLHIVELPDLPVNRPETDPRTGEQKAFARTFSATADRLRNPDQLRRSPVARPAFWRQSQPQTLAPNG
jgi:putative transposase